MGAAFSLLYPSLSLIVVERIPETRRGAALGTFTAFFDAGVGLGAPLAGAAAALTELRGRLPALGRDRPGRGDDDRRRDRRAGAARWPSGAPRPAS